MSYNNDVEKHIYMNGFKEWVDLTYKGLTLGLSKRQYDEYEPCWSDKDIFFSLMREKMDTDEGIYEPELDEGVLDELIAEYDNWEDPPPTIREWLIENDLPTDVDTHNFSIDDCPYKIFVTKWKKWMDEYSWFEPYPEGDPDIALIAWDKSDAEYFEELLNTTLEDKLNDLNEMILDVAGKNGIGTIDNEELIEILFGGCASNAKGYEYGMCDWDRFEEMLDKVLSMSDEELLKYIKQASDKEHSTLKEFVEELDSYLEEYYSEAKSIHENEYGERVRDGSILSLYEGELIAGDGDLPDDVVWLDELGGEPTKTPVWHLMENGSDSQEHYLYCSYLLPDGTEGTMTIEYDEDAGRVVAKADLTNEKTKDNMGYWVDDGHAPLYYPHAKTPEDAALEYVYEIWKDIDEEERENLLWRVYVWTEDREYDDVIIVEGTKEGVAIVPDYLIDWDRVNAEWS